MIIILCFLFAFQLNCFVHHDKWIIVTTIQYPTEALKKLAQIPEWQLLVIGDKKTPKDWHLDNCIYLSAESQQQLPYALAKLLPWNHYSRKNLGYLYAIEHGATIIYETDDDNYLIDGIQQAGIASIVVLNSEYSTINVYDYFGQKNLWPRGYPLTNIKDNSYTLTEEKILKVGVEQGLVNNEPDLDALYRLTHPEHYGIVFNSKNPCSLAKGIFCPFNTQNTVFYRPVFWGLYIPTHVPFRICDIWRGYITQRLLWETEYALCFTAPSAIQDRNCHDYMKDFVGEIDLYTRAHALIETLSKWQAKQNTILEKIAEIYDLLIHEKFIGVNEHELVQAWISDLATISGY